MLAHYPATSCWAFSIAGYADVFYAFAQALLWSLAIGVIYAVSDEIHQYFVPGRSMQISDIVIDSFGVLSGIFVARPRKTGLKTNRKHTMGNVRFPGRYIQLKTNREEHYYSKWSSLVCSV